MAFKLSPVEGTGDRPESPLSFSLSDPSPVEEPTSFRLTSADPFALPAAPATEFQAQSLPDKTWKDAFAEIGDKPSYYLPYLNLSEAYDSVAVLRAVRAFEDGSATEEQQALMDQFMQDQMRGGTFGYKFVSMTARLPAYALEFLTAGGIIKGASKGVVAKGATSSAKQALERVVRLKGIEHIAAEAAIKLTPRAVAQSSLGNGIARFFEKDTLGYVARRKAKWLAARKAVAEAPDAAARTAAEAIEKEMWGKAMTAVGHHLGKAVPEALGPRNALMSHRIANQLVRNMTPVYALDESESGEIERILLDEGDDFWPAFAKAYGDMAIENLSEQTAETFFALRKLWGAESEQFLKAAVLDRGARRLAEATGIDQNEAVKTLLKKHFFGGTGGRASTIQRAGWGGVIPELGEEAIGGALRQVTGIEPFGLPELEDIAAMALSFAVNPLAIGSYASDEITRNVESRSRAANKSLDYVEQVIADNDDGILYREAIEPSLQSIKDYIGFALTQPTGMWEKFKKRVFGQKAQRTVRDIWLERRQADLDNLVNWVKATSDGTELDVEREVDDEMLLRWVTWVSGGVNWVETEHDLRVLQDMGIMDFSSEERRRLNIQGAAVVERGPLTADEIDVMNKYHFLFELQEVSDPNFAGLQELESADFSKSWEQLTVEERKSWTYMVTAGAVADQINTSAQQQYDLIRGTMQRVSGEYRLFNVRKVAYVGTRQEYEEADVPLPPDAIPLPKANEEDEDSFMTFFGAKVNPATKRLMLEFNTSRSSLAEDLIHGWSVGERGAPLLPIMMWADEQSVELSKVIQFTRNELQDTPETDVKERARLEATIAAAESVRRMLVDEEGVISSRFANELWSKLFKMQRLGHAVMVERKDANTGEIVTEVRGEADAIDKWILELGLELPEWADGLMNNASANVPGTLEFLANRDAPYDPTARAYVNYQTGEVSATRPAIPGNSDDLGPAPGARTPPAPPARPAPAAATPATGLDEESNFVDEEEPPPAQADAAPVQPKQARPERGPANPVESLVQPPEEASAKPKSAAKAKLKRTAGAKRGQKGQNRARVGRGGARRGVQASEGLQAPAARKMRSTAPEAGDYTEEELEIFRKKAKEDAEAAARMTPEQANAYQRIQAEAAVTAGSPTLFNLPLNGVPAAWINMMHSWPDAAWQQVFGSMLTDPSVQSNIPKLLDYSNVAITYLAYGAREFASEEIKAKLVNMLNVSEEAYLEAITAGDLEAQQRFAWMNEMRTIITGEHVMGEVQRENYEKLLAEQQVEPTVEEPAEEPEIEIEQADLSVERQRLIDVVRQYEQRSQRTQDGMPEDDAAEIIAAQMEDDGEYGQTSDEDQEPTQGDGETWGNKAEHLIERPQVREIILAINPIGQQGEATLWSKSRSDEAFIAAVQTPEAWAEYLADNTNDEWFKKAFRHPDGTPKFDHYWVRSIQRTFAAYNKPQVLQVEITRKYVDPRDRSKGWEDEKQVIVANRANRAIQWMEHMTDRAEILFQNPAVHTRTLNNYFARVGRLDENAEPTLEPRDFDVLVHQGGQRRAPTIPEMAELMAWLTGIDQDVWETAGLMDPEILPILSMKVDQLMRQAILPTGANVREGTINSKILAARSKFTTQLFGWGRTGNQNIRSNIQRIMDVQTDEDYIAARFRNAAGKMASSYVRASDLVISLVDELGVANLEAEQIPVAMWGGRRMRGFHAGKRGVDGKDEMFNEVLDDLWQVWNMEEAYVDGVYTRTNRRAGEYKGQPRVRFRRTDDYWQLVSQMGDKMRPILAKVQRLTVAEARDTYTNAFYETDAEGNLVPRDFAQDMFDKGFAIPLDEIAERASEFADRFEGAEKGNAEQFYWNWVVNGLILQEIAFGSSSQYDSVQARNKRAASTPSDGLPVELYPVGKDGIGDIINAVYISDETWQGGGGIQTPLLDGIVLMTGEHSRRLKNGMTASQLPRHLTPEQAERYELHASKALYSGRRVENTDQRALHKANYLNLDVMADQNPDSVFPQILEWVNAYNEGKPYEEQIHHVVPTSSAKVRVEGKDIGAFAPLANGRYQFVAPQPTGQQIEGVQARYFIVQNPLVNPVVPRKRRMPSQATAIFLDLPSGERITELGNERLNAQFIRWQSRPFRPWAYLDPEKNADIASYQGTLHWWNPLISNRVEAVVTSKLEQQVVRPQANKVLLQEMPYGSDPTVTDYQPMNLVEGRWVAGELTENSKVRLPRVATALSDRYVRPRQVSKWSDWNMVAAHIRANSSLYRDLFILDETGEPTRELKEWEFEQDESGVWVIPGGIMAMVRVPADSHHSTVFARQGRTIDGDADMLVAHSKIQEIGGSDSDGDQRHMLLLYLNEDGEIELPDEFGYAYDRGRYNQMLLLAAQDHSTPEVYRKTQRPIDTSAYREWSNKWADARAAGKKKAYANTPEGYEEAFEAHRVGNELIGIFARYNVTYMALRQIGFSLKRKEAGKDRAITLTGNGYDLLISRPRGADMDVDGELSAHIGNLMNMALDNGKDPQLEAMGINPQTAGLAMLMVMSNPNLRTYEDFRQYIGQISNFLNSPLVRTYVQVANRVQQVADKGSLTRKTMWTDIEAAVAIRNRNVKLDPDAESELTQMRKLRELVEIAEEMRELAQTIKHTVEVPKTYAAARDLQAKVAKITGNEYRTLDLSELTDNDGNLHPILNGLRLSTGVADRMFSSDIMGTLVAESAVDELETKYDQDGVSYTDPLTTDDLERVRNYLSTAFLLQGIDYQPEAGAFLVDIHKQIQADLARNGKANAFLESLIEITDTQSGKRYLQLLPSLTRGQLEKEQYEQIHQGFNDLTTYWSEKEFKIRQNDGSMGTFTLKGTEIQDMFAMETLLRFGPTLSANGGGWAAMLSDRYWKNKRGSFERVMEEWTNGVDTYDAAGTAIQLIKSERERYNNRGYIGEYDDFDEDEYEMFSVTLAANWGRMNPGARLFGSQEFHSFLVDMQNWSRSEYHRALKIVDKMVSLAGGGKLVGHVALPHRDDDGYDIIDVNRVHNVEVDEDGNVELLDEKGNIVDAIVSTADNEAAAFKEVARLDKELKARQPDEDSRRTASEVLEAVTAVIEGTTSDLLSADHPLFTMTGRTTDANGRDVKDYIVFKGIVRGEPVEEGDPPPKMMRVFYNRGANGELVPILKRNGQPVEVYDVNVVRVADVIAEIGRDHFARLVNLTRNAMGSRTRINQRMTQLLGQDEWLNFRARYMPHRFDLSDEGLTDEEKAEARARAKLIFGSRFDTNRAKRRVFPDYLTAAMERGLEPVTMRSDELVRMWFGEILKTATNRLLLSYGMTTVDMDGSSLWMPVFDESDEALSKELLKPIGQQTLFRALENAASHFNQRRRMAGLAAGEELTRESYFVPDTTKDARTEWGRFYKFFTKGEMKAAGYDTPLKDGSRYPGIKNWYVRKPTDHPGPYSNAANNLIKMIEQPAYQPKKIFNRDWFEGIQRFNEWSKTTGLSFSIFHPAALLESFIALGGISINNVNQILLPRRTFRRVRNLFRQEKAWGHITNRWVRQGLMVDTTNPNFLRLTDFNTVDQANQTLVQKDLDWLIEKDWPAITQGAKLYKKYLHWMDRWLWSEMFPALKLYMAEQVFDEMKANLRARGYVGIEDNQLRRDISRMLNHALGGQNWSEYIWMTPERRQLLHMLMFAPDWTMSAFNIAQAGQLPGISRFLRVPSSQVEKEYAWRKYWPGMAVIVMTGIPQAIQLAIYAAFGDPDEDDTPWITENEPEKDGALGIKGLGGHIDMTPMLRKLGWVPVVGYKGEPSGKRRVYLRWAKQATEVYEGWLTRPMQTLFGKSSAAVRTAYEQITGTNTAGWELKFSGEGLSGFFQSSEGKILDSRLGYVTKKFLPMSMVGILEGRPSAFFAPASRGTTLFTATNQLAGVLEAYANDRVHLEVQKDRRRVANLAALGPEILRAVERNGYDPNEVLTRAKSHVLGRLYGDFFLALQANDQKKLEKVAISINRVHGTIDGLNASMKKRAEQVRKFWSDEDEARLKLLVNGRIEN